MARSRSYPVISLDVAAEAIRKVVMDLGRGANDRDSVARAFGYTSGTGLAARKVSALVQFGFLELVDSNYQASPLSEVFLHPRTEREERIALLTALRKPTLFADLLDKFQPQGRVPSQLANILVRDHGITPEASADAAAVFLRSIQFAGVADGDGRFRFGDDEETPAQASIEVSGVPARRRVGRPPDSEAPPASSFEATPGQTPAPRNPPPPPPPPADTFQGAEQVLRISLSGGTAELRIPQKITDRDFKKLQKWLELVELDVTVETSAGTVRAP